jgi:ABC-type branched-subunit amino acid transport system substrate-binding protein
MKALGQRHRDRFGVLPGNPTDRSYNSVMLYAAALRNSASTPAQIRGFSYSLKEFDGVCGPVTFDKDGITVQRPVVRDWGGQSGLIK